MPSPPIRRIAISTGGGDAPGLNAVIRAVALAAMDRHWECVGIRDGFDGLLEPQHFPHGGLLPLTRSAVSGITHLGGTILGTTNRGHFHAAACKPGYTGYDPFSGEYVM